MKSANPSQPDRDLSASAVHAHISGNGEKVILLHGGRGSHTHWIRNIDALSQHHSVYALDLPGFGDAPDVPRGISADEYLSLVHQAVQKLIGDDDVSVVGFSFGGAVAADLCRRLGKQCRHLVLMGPGGFGEAKGRQLDLKPAPSAIQADPRYRAVIKHNLLAMMLHNAGRVDQETIDIQCKNIAHARFNSLVVSLQPNLLSNLAAITCPLLMIWGEKDLVAYPTPEDRAAQCRAIKPDARVTMIPDAGHWVQYEQPDRVNELLLSFLRS